MLAGKVIGNVWAIRKDERIAGVKLLIVKPINYNSNKEDGMPIIAADCIGAGIGDKVIVVKGSSARSSVGDVKVPIDASIIAIIDGEEIVNDL